MLVSRKASRIPVALYTSKERCVSEFYTRSAAEIKSSRVAVEVAADNTVSENTVFRNMKKCFIMSDKEYLILYIKFHGKNTFNLNINIILPNL